MKWKISVPAALTLALSSALVTADQTVGRESKPVVTEILAHTHLVAAGGLVEPATEARQLAATVVGRIIKVNFGEGDHVVTGDVIAEIENDDLKAELVGAQASVTARANELIRLKAGAREQEIAAGRAELREAEAIAANAASNFERRVALGAKQIVSKEAVDQARADRDTAEARRDLLAQRLSLLVAPPRSEDVAIAQANLGAARARITEITSQIEKTIVRSPIDGVVLKLFHRAGETVSNLPPTPIATVGDTSQLRVRADIDESDVAQISVGQTVWVTADAYRDKRFHGRVAQIGGQLGRKNFRNDNPDERLDTKILEVMIDLDPGAQLPIGLPVDVKVDNLPKDTKLSDASQSLRGDTETVFKHLLSH